MAPWVVPLLHPAALIRGRWAERGAQIRYMSRAVGVTEASETPEIHIEAPPPGSIVRPQVADLARFDAMAAAPVVGGMAAATGPEAFTHLSVDIENAGHFTVLVGLTLFEGRRIGPSLSLPFRTQHGMNYWEPEEHWVATGYLYRWLADERLTKVFHNGVAHDIPLLEETGFIVAGPIEDTMIMQHYCYPEMRKALQYCATLYLGAPVWKTLLDEEEPDEK